MKHDKESDLVRRCLNGSQSAWKEFYQQYSGLVRSVVKKKIGLSYEEAEDMVQDVFVVIISSLRLYDRSYSVAKFVCMIAERACIDMYRRTKAQKRNAFTEPLNVHDGDSSGAVSVMSDDRSPEENVATYEHIEILGAAMNRLGTRCRQLLKLRYYDEIPYKEICTVYGGKENTLAVRLRSCLDQLSRKYHDLTEKDNEGN